jgi:hypothetical protein
MLGARTIFQRPTTKVAPIADTRRCEFAVDSGRFAHEPAPANGIKGNPYIERSGFTLRRVGIKYTRVAVLPYKRTSEGI